MVEINQSTDIESPRIDKIEGAKNIDARKFNIPRELGDIFAVKGGNPNFVYGWLNVEPKRLSWLKAKGWEVLDAAQAKKDGLDVFTPDGRPIGTTRKIGDLVLARIPKEIYQESKRRALERANILNRSNKERFLNETNKKEYKGFVEGDDD